MIIDTRVCRPVFHLPAAVRLYVQILITALLLISIGTTTAMAAEFSIEPFIQGGIRFDTNPRLQSSSVDFESAEGTIIDVRLPITYRTPRLSTSLDPRIVASFYRDSDDDDLEDRDKYLTGTTNWGSQLANTGASYGYTDLSLRTSEFQDAGDSPEGGSGGTRIFRKDSQKRGFIHPYWQYRLSPKSLFSLNGGYDEVWYDEGIVSRRFDYDYTSAAAAFQHALNERHTLTLQARFTKFDSENKQLEIENDSESNNLSLIYTYTWSERSEISADIGWARTENTVQRPNIIFQGIGILCDPALSVCETKSNSTNFVGNLTATHESETVEYRVVIGQSITPNSNGAEVLRFNINALARKRFTERFSARLGILAFTQNNVGDSDFDFKRDYIRSTLGLSYRFTRRWSLYGTYSYTFNTEERVLADDPTSRNHYASMGIRFQGDGWRW